MSNVLLICECRKIIQGMKDKIILTPDGGFYADSTIRNTEMILNNLEEYTNTLDEDVTMKNINFKFTEDYRLWLLNTNYSKNTISLYMSKLRFWIKHFHKYGLIEYSDAGIRASDEMTTAVINTIDELKYLYNLELPEGQRKVIDIYICQCFLGLRVSDMFSFIKQINKTTKIVDGQTFFEVENKKTKATVVIPASKIVLEIFKKYSYDFGKTFSAWYYNRTLKSIVSKSKIERNVLFHRTEGGDRIERTVTFSSLISSHTARRTFASNAYLMGIDPLDIMKITGHKSYNSFFKYIRCENLAVALRISTHQFFNIDFFQ